MQELGSTATRTIEILAIGLWYDHVESTIVCDIYSWAEQKQCLGLS